MSSRAAEIEYRLPAEFKPANIVICGKYSQKLNLERVCERSHRLEYNPESFPGIVFRSRCCFLIFGSGAITVTGIKDVRDFRLDMADLERITGLELQPVEWEIKNSTASTKLGPTAHKELQDHPSGEYAPESGPHVIVRIKDGLRCTLVVTKTGHCYVTGLKSRRQAEELLALLRSWGYTPKVA